MATSVDQRAHAASKRGGWGVRMYGGSWPNPSGSSLNSYSLGDVVCWDTREDAETAAREYMSSICGYSKCEVEWVEKGQHQKSIAEELEEIAIAKARSESRNDALREVCGWFERMESMPCGSPRMLATLIRQRFAVSS